MNHFHAKGIAGCNDILFLVDNIKFVVSPSFDDPCGLDLTATLVHVALLFALHHGIHFTQGRDDRKSPNLLNL